MQAVRAAPRRRRKVRSAGMELVKKGLRRGDEAEKGKTIGEGLQVNGGGREQRGRAAEKLIKTESVADARRRETASEKQ